MSKYNVYLSNLDNTTISKYNLYIKDDIGTASKFQLEYPNSQEDELSYSVNTTNQTFTITINNPSERTQYLCSQGRLYIGLDVKTTANNYYYYSDPDDPDHYVRYRYHPRWHLDPTINGGYLTKINSLDTPMVIHYYPTPETPHIDYILKLADWFHNPDLNTYFFSIRPILISAFGDNGSLLDIETSSYRTYAPAQSTTIIVSRS